MTAPLDWRKIEQELEREIRSRGVETFQNEGAWWVTCDDGDEGGISVSLTALAKHLADELGGV